MKSGKRSCEPPKELQSNIATVLRNTKHITKFKPCTKARVTQGDMVRFAEFKVEQEHSKEVYLLKKEERTRRILSGKKVIYVQ